MSPHYDLLLLLQVYLGMKRQVEQLSWIEKYLPSSVGGRIADGIYIAHIEVLHGIDVGCCICLLMLLLHVHVGAPQQECTYMYINVCK